MTLPSTDHLLQWLLTLCLGFVGGTLAQAIGAPLPWLLGGMAATGIVAVGGFRPFDIDVGFPMTARLVCIPVIGVLIGSAFTPAVLSSIPGWWPGLVAIAVFVPAAHAMNYVLFRRIGRLDRASAYFSAMPGGLIEAIEIARDTSANLATVTVMQFARIAVTVTAVPLIFAAIQGRAVGSAAGQTIGAGAALTATDALVLFACGLLGFVVARRLHLPAGQILGPIVASALAHVSGLTAASPPAVLVSIAQLVIGITLGLRFKGLEPRSLLRFLGLSALSVAAMLVLGVLLALPIAALGVAPVPVMVLSLAPGGLVEMGLIALSLQASPIFVTAHHLARILLTVSVGVAGWKRLSARN